MANARVRAVQELRRSSATTPVTKPRVLTAEQDIAEQLQELEDNVPCASDFCCGGKNDNP